MKERNMTNVENYTQEAFMAEGAASAVLAAALDADSGVTFATVTDGVAVHGEAIEEIIKESFVQDDPADAVILN